MRQAARLRRLRHSAVLFCRSADPSLWLHLSPPIGQLGSGPPRSVTANRAPAGSRMKAWWSVLPGTGLREVTVPPAERAAAVVMAGSGTRICMVQRGRICGPEAFDSSDPHGGHCSRAVVDEDVDVLLGHVAGTRFAARPAQDLACRRWLRSKASGVRSSRRAGASHGPAVRKGHRELFAETSSACLRCSRQQFAVEGLADVASPGRSQPTARPISRLDTARVHSPAAPTDHRLRTGGFRPYSHHL